MSILLYIYFSLQNLVIPLILLAIVFGMVFFIGAVVEESPTIVKHTKSFVIYIIVTLLISTIPDIKQMSMIFGIPAAMELSKNPDVQKIPQNILNIINQELEEKVKKNEDKKEDK